MAEDGKRGKKREGGRRTEKTRVRKRYVRPMRREQWIDAVEMGVELGMRKAEQRQTAERISNGSYN
ncbi:uncharacterized protein BO88DRAFT_404251 [Aspergillus vadensis CBS 113365]|uniref:Uncharacterized protein n=1 Tax=Aspergillus vadensis (strain CBS 113365 / IMI 142717 / IBT 24658) TaxID=1448311 RepID=A0A319C3B1_ASPVC|nr:hypothetical protein BO88DRAFT_404251 [Aspergillus vadensis CBS 113365]PYH69908.1 hypothetical protein BO88DRAFT_404251 [Aspergillus vadensis CBS 113365]